jgi:hypothetical protein
VALQLAELLSPSDAVRRLAETSLKLLGAYGDDPEATSESFRAAQKRLEG